MAFRIADDNDLLLIDEGPAENAAVHWRQPQVHHPVSNISPASIGAIQRGLMRLEAGADVLR